MRTLFLLVAMMLASPASAETLMHDGVQRNFIVEGSAKNAPALIVLHGGGGTGKRIRRYLKLTLADKGWVVIYPDAVKRAWNDGRHSVNGGPLRAEDDLGFLKAMVRTLADQGRINPARVHALGVSNGGAMTQRIVCQAPGLLVGAVISIMNFPVGLDCPPGQPTPMLFLLGTADPIVPFAGGPIVVGRTDRGAVRPAMETLQFWADRNMCGQQLEVLLPDTAPDDGTRIRRLDHAFCSANLRAFIMEGGGHVWPGRLAPRAIQRVLGNPVFDIDGTAVAEEFLTTMIFP